MFANLSVAIGRAPPIPGQLAGKVAGDIVNRFVERLRCLVAARDRRVAGGAVGQFKIDHLVTRVEQEQQGVIGERPAPGVGAFDAVAAQERQSLPLQACVQWVATPTGRLVGKRARNSLVLSDSTDRVH